MGYLIESKILLFMIPTAWAASSIIFNVFDRFGVVASFAAIPVS
jgi:hypothetical protein